MIEHEGMTLLQLAKDLGVQPKRVLSWEYNGMYEPVFRRKGRRLVRVYPPSLTELITRAVALVGSGYGPKLAFYMAKRGETPGVATSSGPHPVDRGGI